MQTSVVQLTQHQLNDAADVAIAEFAFATGQPLRLVDDFFAREAFKKVVSEWIDSAAVESEVELDDAADATADDGAVEVVDGDMIELA